MVEQGDLGTLILAEPSTKGAIFDFDGVLVRLHTDYDAMREELKRYSAVELGLDTDFSRISCGLTCLRLDRGRMALAGALMIIERVERAFLDRAEINADLLETARALRHDGKRLAVFSMNTRATVDTLLRLAGARELFDLLVTVEDVTKYKPDPEGIEKVLLTFNMKSLDVVYIGDREIDREAGEKAVVRTFILEPRRSRWEPIPQ